MLPFSKGAGQVPRRLKYRRRPIVLLLVLHLRTYLDLLAQDKVMFGSDYAAISPERWLTDFETAPFTDEVRPLILLENAKRVLKLDGLL